jgi:hypothetical protein
MMSQGGWGGRSSLGGVGQQQRMVSSMSGGGSGLRRSSAGGGLAGVSSSQRAGEQTKAATGRQGGQQAGTVGAAGGGGAGSKPWRLPLDMRDPYFVRRLTLYHRFRGFVRGAVLLAFWLALVLATLHVVVNTLADLPWYTQMLRMESVSVFVQVLFVQLLSLAMHACWLDVPSAANGAVTTPYGLANHVLAPTALLKTALFGLLAACGCRVLWGGKERLLCPANFPCPPDFPCPRGSDISPCADNYSRLSIAVGFATGAAHSLSIAYRRQHLLVLPAVQQRMLSRLRRSVGGALRRAIHRAALGLALLGSTTSLLMVLKQGRMAADLDTLQEHYTWALSLFETALVEGAEAPEGAKVVSPLSVSLALMAMACCTLVGFSASLELLKLMYTSTVFFQIPDGMSTEAEVIVATVRGANNHRAPWLHWQAMARLATMAEYSAASRRDIFGAEETWHAVTHICADEVLQLTHVLRSLKQQTRISYQRRVDLGWVRERWLSPLLPSTSPKYA